MASCLGVALGTNHSYVTTPSMYPTIPPGSEIFVRSAQDYRVGDVIEFKANGLVWAHRLVEIKPDGTYVTKGDNPQNAPDVFVPALTRKDVVGKVVLAPRWLGFPELILHHPGYGLSWMRAELGVPGKLIVVALVALVSLVPGSSGKKRSAHAETLTSERGLENDDSAPYGESAAVACVRPEVGTP